MEDSEKRRERLKAMRMEALQGGVDHVVRNSAGPHHLLNPLGEASPFPPLQNNSPAPPRFDYYTDPMAAFSTDKRRSKVSDQNSHACFTPPRQMYPETTHSPIHQVQPNYSPDQRMYLSGAPYHNSGSMTPTPSNQLQMNYSADPRTYQARGAYQSSGPTTPSPAHQSQSNYSPNHSMYRVQGPYQTSGPYGSPVGMVSPLGPRQGSSCASSYYIPPNSSGVGNFSSPRFGGSPRYGGPTSGLGFGGSPTSNSGRGRGRSSGRGRGFRSHESVSAELRPDLYYNKSMVEDPWELLTPVIWKRENVISKVDFVRSSFPKSTSIKKARISGGLNESSSSSRPSLAEYLASAFNEAANDGASGNDKPNL